MNIINKNNQYYKFFIFALCFFCAACQTVSKSSDNISAQNQCDRINDSSEKKLCLLEIEARTHEHALKGGGVGAAAGLLGSRVSGNSITYGFIIGGAIGSNIGSVIGEERESLYVSVPVFFATDRKATGNTKPAKFYGGEWGDISYGKVNVTIPASHKIGNLETPYWMHLEFYKKKEKHVTLNSLSTMNEDSFIKDLRQKTSASQGKEALLFIHGYNTSFEDAARRTGQITYDLEFKGPSILYSWPSQGVHSGYTYDSANVDRTVGHLEYFLSKLMEVNELKKIHIIAHSMGNRALVGALSRIKGNMPNGEHTSINEIFLAAPDIDTEVFRQLASRFVETAQRTTIYVSKNDEALSVSKKFNGYPRAGDSSDGITIVDKADVVDVSSVDDSLIGHGYYGDNRTVISDMYYAIQGMLPSTRYGLKEATWKDKKYWIFQP